MRGLLAAGFWAAFSAAAFAQAAFLDGAPDVPLPPGAQALASSAVTPEAVGGQHLVFFVGAEGPAEAVLGFYRETLPQLGWAPTAQDAQGLAYARGRDQLALRVLEASPGERVVLMVEVQSAPASQALD